MSAASLFLYFLKVRHTFFFENTFLELSLVGKDFALGLRGNQALV